MEGRRPRTISSRASGRTGRLEGENTEEQQTQHQTKRQTQNRCEGGGERPGQAQKTDIEISRVRRGGGRTLHYGAGSGVVGPREADSEGEAKNHKRQAQHGVEGGAPGPKPLVPYNTRGSLAEWAEEGDARCTAAQGVVPWGHVKPTQRGKPKTTNARHSMVRGRSLSKPSIVRLD